MPFDYQRIRQWPIALATEHYSPQDCATYARGIGCGLAAPYAAREQPYLDGTEALPTMAVILGAEGALWTNEPETGIEWKRMLHAEEAVRLVRPLANSGTIATQFKVDEIYDKGADKGALMYESAQLRDEAGEEIANVLVTMFLRGNGGCGGSAAEPPRPAAIPGDRPADVLIDLPTPRDEDAIYKLPAIFDAARSVNSGTAQSMLRGVCAFGLAGRALIHGVCGSRASQLCELGLRYAGPVFTSETLQTEIWNLGSGRYAFRVRALERDSVVMNNGYAAVFAD